MSDPSLLEKAASTRRGSSCGSNARLIKSSRAGGLKLRKKDESENDQYSEQERRRLAEDVPFSPDVEVVTVSWGLMGAKAGTHSPTSRLGTARVPSICWISSLWPRTFSSSDSACGGSTHLLRVPSISDVSLMLIDMVRDQTGLG